MARQPTPSALASALASAVTALSLAACGGGDIDHEDEAGAPGDTRVELVYIGGDSAVPGGGAPTSGASASGVDTAAQAWPSPAGDASPADDEADAGGELEVEAGAEAAAGAEAGAAAGGDEAIAYDPHGAFTVQVGHFEDADRARQRVRELVALGYPAYANAHPGTLGLRVRIGYFATREHAERFGQRFARDHGGQFWVDRRGAEEGAPR